MRVRYLRRPFPRSYGNRKCIVSSNNKRPQILPALIPARFSPVTKTGSTRWYAASRAVVSTASEDNKAPPAAKEVSDAAIQLRIFKTLFRHLWPDETVDDNNPSKLSIDRIRLRKRRVLGSIGLMVGGKALTIQVPFLFKHLVDAMPSSSTEAVVASLASDPVVTVSTGLPVAVLLGYGISRAAASGFNELRNAVFAHVAQDAIRSVGKNYFDHVHQLDMQFHLSRNTGQLSRVLDRGQRSISFILNAMVFHIGPTIVEVGLVTGLMACNFGWEHSGVVLVTVGAYSG